MDLFDHSSTVRLRSHNNKYLVAGEDQESVFQARDGSTRNAHWTIEIIEEDHICFKSCYGKYLTASNKPFLPGRRGRNLRVVQTLPDKLNSSVQWEPVKREGDSKVMFKTRYGNVLQSNGGPPPWKNSVTHDVPRKSTQIPKRMLWQVEKVETLSDEWREYQANIISRSIEYVRNICYDYTKKKKKNKESSDSVKEGSGSSGSKKPQSAPEYIRSFFDLLGYSKGNQ